MPTLDRSLIHSYIHPRFHLFIHPFIIHPSHACIQPFVLSSIHPLDKLLADQESGRHIKLLP